MARRDEWLRRAARRDGRPPARSRPWRRPGLALLVSWLVLMTVWGVGRSGFPDHAGWFLAGGLFAGAVTAVVLGRRR